MKNDFLLLAKIVLDNCGDCLFDALEGFQAENGKETIKFIRSHITKGELSDTELGQFRDWLYDSLLLIENKKGYEYASEEAGYADLALVSV